MLNLELIEELPLLLRVLLVALIPTIMTVLGSIPLLLGMRMGEKILDAALGFSAGVMLSAAFIALLLPAIESSSIEHVTLWFVVGVLIIRVLDMIIPHTHEHKPVGKFKYRKSLLIGLAIIIHNIPEGMAVGASTIYNLNSGLILSLAIGSQDLPEGLAAGLPLLASGGTPLQSFTVGVLSGVVELLSALIPLGLYYMVIPDILPLILALASGAMIYVVVHEIVPSIFGHGHEEHSTLGFFIGFILMLWLESLTIQ